MYKFYELSEKHVHFSNSVLGWHGQGSEDSSPGTGRGVVNGRGLSSALQALSNATLGE